MASLGILQTNSPFNEYFGFAFDMKFGYKNHEGDGDSRVTRPVTQFETRNKMYWHRCPPRKTNFFCIDLL